MAHYTKYLANQLFFNTSFGLAAFYI